LEDVDDGSFATVLSPDMQRLFASSATKPTAVTTVPDTEKLKPVAVINPTTTATE